MNYTRKRALLACDFCRHRKRKCDGARPKCSTCVESNADCVYKELPFDRVESSSPTAVVERLTRIEALLEEQGQRLNDLALGSSSSTTPNPFSLPPLAVNPSPQLIAASPASVSNPSHDPMEGAHVDNTQFLIPLDHTTSTTSLLAYPMARAIVGDYPKDFFYNLEANMPLPPALDILQAQPTNWPALNPQMLESFASNYFTAVHPNFPLFTVQTFKEWQANLFQNGPIETAETAVCLCVYALGCIVSPQQTSVAPELQQEKDELGMRFFQPALRIILGRTVWDFQTYTVICQALLLAASYFAHHGRPLHSWKMTFYASHKFLFLLDKRKRAGLFSDHDDHYLRIFWSCFMIEWAAELEIPRSGIEPMADKMPLPRSLEPSENDDIIYFVAETAIRRLMNRIHSALYSAENSPDAPPFTFADPAPNPNSLSLNKLLTLSSELNRQLEEWYNSIPGKLRPPIGTESIPSFRGRVLRIRYYAARHLIHRPFVLYVSHHQPTTPLASTGSTPSSSSTPQPLYPSFPRLILEKCETCISSCRTYLYNVAEMLEKRTPYLWSFSQSALACNIVLTLADTCPQLRPFVPDLDALQAMVIPRLRRWEVKGCSFEAEVKILEALAMRDRYAS